jgi:hypothetical protein
MNRLDEGKELSKDVSYHLNESAVHGSGGPTSQRNQFKIIDYKNKGSVDRMETIFAKSRAEQPRLSWQSGAAGDGFDGPDKIPRELVGFDPYFFASYLTGFFLSVFGIAFLFTFCTKAIYHRAGIYGATASMFFINLWGLYFLTSLIWDLNAHIAGPATVGQLGSLGGGLTVEPSTTSAPTMIV